MMEFLRYLPSTGVMGALFVLIPATTIVAITAIVQIRMHHQHKLDTDLKLEMLAKGMSADEIVKVISAGHGKISGSGV